MKRRRKEWKKGRKIKVFYIEKGEVKTTPEDEHYQEIITTLHSHKHSRIHSLLLSPLLRNYFYYKHRLKGLQYKNQPSVGQQCDKNLLNFYKRDQTNRSTNYLFLVRFEQVKFFPKWLYTWSIYML